MPVNQLTIAPVASGTEMEAAQEPKVEVFIEVSSSPPLERCQSTDSSASSVSSGTCKICHCGTEVGDELISPCLCSGSLLYVHQGCLQKWIKSTDARSCELCQYPYQIDSTLKPLVQWRPLELTHSEKRKLLCSIAFHIVAVTCILWSLWVLIDRTADEVKDGDLKWPFWTKLVVVAIGFVGGVVFMYVQCKVYVLLFHRLKAFNRLLFVRSVPLEVRGKLKSIQLEEEAAKNTS